MPTGYTASVEDGSITELRDYILLCARAFGALIELRDEPLSTPIPEQLEASTEYYDRQIAALQARIDEIAVMSSDEALTASLAAADELRRQHREREANDQLKLERHLAMAEKVRAWHSPSEDHDELKMFMLQQLEMSTKWLGSSRPAPESKLGEEWRAELLADLAERLASSYANRNDEIQRQAKRQRWLDDLRGSLPPQEAAHA